MILDNIGICIDITLLRTVADDLLKCEKIEKWCLLKLTGRKGLFTSHLGLLIVSFSNLQIWKKWCEKEMGLVQTFKKVQAIQKVNFVIKTK